MGLLITVNSIWFARLSFFRYLLSIERILWQIQGESAAMKRLAKHATERYLDTVAVGLRTISKLPSHSVHHVRYADLIADTPSTVSQILSFLDLPATSPTNQSLQQTVKKREFKPHQTVQNLTSYIDDEMMRRRLEV